jgi:hypothetical protein
MQYMTNLQQHPEFRKERFPSYLWPSDLNESALAEWWVLLEFLQASSIPIQTPPKKLNPPGPDFECTIDGRKRLFELGEILDSSLAEGLAHSASEANRKQQARDSGDLELAKSIKTSGFRMMSANGSLERMLRRKLAKEYDCGGIPCDLLLFYDRQTPFGPFEYLLSRSSALFDSLRSSCFENIWLFNLTLAKVMGRARTDSNGHLQVIFDYDFRFDKRARFEALVPGAADELDRIRWFEPVLSPLHIPNK